MSDKYNDLFDFYIKLYDDEIARFRELDNKIARFLSVYSIMIALTGFVGLNLRFILRGAELNTLVLINYICLASVLLLLIPGWYYLLSGLKLDNIQRFAYNQKIIDFFSNYELIDIKYALSVRAKDAIEYNVEVGNKKAKKIVKAFKWSFFAMGLFIVSLLLATFNVYLMTINDNKHETEVTHSNVTKTQERPITMSDQNQGNSDTAQQIQPKTQEETPKPNEPKPNPDVHAPENVLITEGYESPPKKTGNKNSQVRIRLTD